MVPQVLQGEVPNLRARNSIEQCFLPRAGFFVFIFMLLLPCHILICFLPVCAVDKEGACLVYDLPTIPSIPIFPYDLLSPPVESDS